MSGPAITPTDVERLVSALSSGVWMSAADLALLLYGSPAEAHKRRIRATASAAGHGIVSYPGSPGYRLFTACTVAELHACIAAYGHQTDEMRRRRDLYRRALHRLSPARIEPSPDLRPAREQLQLL